MISKTAETKSEVAEEIRPKNLAWLEKPSREIGLVSIVLVLLLALRLYHLTNKSLWSDEIHDVLIGYENSFWDSLTYYQPFLVHPPLFSFLMHVWIHTIGISEFTLRIFSVVSAMLTLFAIYWLVRQWFNQTIALFSILLLGVSPLHLFWSQSIRPYAWYTLLVVISMALLWWCLQQPQKSGRWLLWGLSLPVLLYAHYSAIHIIFAQVVIVGLIYLTNWPVLVRLGLGLVLGALGFLPWFSNFLEQTKADRSATYSGRGPTQMLEVIEAFSSWFSPTYLAIFVGTVFLPLFGLGLWWLWQNSRRLAIFLGMWSLLPVLTIWLSGFVKANFSLKQVIPYAPPFLIVVAVGACTLSRYWKFAPGLVITAAMLLNLAAFYNYDKNYIYQDWRGLVNYVIANQQPGDMVLIANPYGYNVGNFNYYYRYLQNAPGNLPTRWVNPVSLLVNISPEEQQNIKSQMNELFKEPKRVWIVASYDGQTEWMKRYTFPNVPADFRQLLYKEYPTTEQNPIGLGLYERKN